MDDTFYFLAFVGRSGPTPAVTVIDLAYCVDYEREDWATIGKVNYSDPAIAIARARAFAWVNGYSYKPFESRYDSSLNESRWDVV